MACTNALSVFWCGAPDLPGLTNSRKTTNTLGGGVTPSALTCATTVTALPVNKAIINHNPMYRFMPHSLLSLSVLWVTKKAEMKTGEATNQHGLDFASLRRQLPTSVKPAMRGRLDEHESEEPDCRESRGGGGPKETFPKTSGNSTHSCDGVKQITARPRLSPESDRTRRQRRNTADSAEAAPQRQGLFLRHDANRCRILALQARTAGTTGSLRGAGQTGAAAVRQGVRRRPGAGHPRQVHRHRLQRCKPRRVYRVVQPGRGRRNTKWRQPAGNLRSGSCPAVRHRSRPAGGSLLFPRGSEPGDVGFAAGAERVRHGCAELVAARLRSAEHAKRAAVAVCRRAVGGDDDSGGSVRQFGRNACSGEVQGQKAGFVDSCDNGSVYCRNDGCGEIDGREEERDEDRNKIEG